jgi:hypothetical protein
MSEEKICEAATPPEEWFSNGYTLEDWEDLTPSEREGVLSDIRHDREVGE